MSPRRVVVTGAAGGLGRALVAGFVEEGAVVVAVDLDEAGLAEVAAGKAVIPVVADICQEESVEAIVAAAGEVDLLCNNAAIMDGFAQAHEVAPDIWRRVLEINLTGPFLLANALIPSMLDRGRGVIINIASVGGLRGGRAGAAYTASKFGLVGLTQSIAAAYGDSGIRCNAICPGAIDTSMVSGVEPTPFGKRLRERDSGKPRRANPDEIVAVARFLGSDSASYVNGAVVPVDGGWLAY